MSNSRLSDFIAARARETYPEPRTAGHDDLTERMATILEPFLLPGCSVLDVGCGQGPALDWFAANLFLPVGITNNADDLAACRERGHTVRDMDMHEMTFAPESFDCVWARHVLEHSVSPLFVLTEFARLLKPGGIIYAEMPAPDTSCAHQTNANHYGVFTASCWKSLIERAGFAILEARDINLQTGSGPDTYFSFIARKL
jgi:2-polyprenyl-3-methyl-5-hydroxy-6-metoxy-1,4-benzoquinol methylase